MKKILIAFLILPVFIGCGPEIFIAPLVSPLIQGAIMWKEGEAHKYYNLDSDSVYRAAKRTANEVGLPLERDDPEKNGNYYFVVGQNDRLKISVDRVEERITRVSVRVNTMGDKPYAEFFYKQLDAQINVITFDSNGVPRY